MAAHILIVEDEGIVVQDIQEMLQRLGYKTTTALSGEEAIHKAAEARPDLALLDIRLQSQMDGVETASQLRNDFNVPIIYLTAYADENTLQRAKVTQPFGYLFKPFDERELHVAIEIALYKQQAEDTLVHTITELQRVNQELEDANRLTQLFADIMRHDLLNPINVIRDFARLLLTDLSDNTQKSMALRIKNGADKLIEMVENASLYARLGNVSELERARRDLNEMFRAAAETLRPLLEKKAMYLVYLPQGKYYAMVNPMIEAVFSNLLSNAIKYSPEGSRIEVGILEAGEHHRLYVKDWGSGIADANKTRVFDRFERADKSGVEGSGLGLAIVKRIVELHSGRVWIEDNPEGGSVFYIDLPRLGDGRPTMARAPEGARKTALVIEDSTVQALAIKALLEREGVVVLCAPNGRVGVFMAEQFVPDVIILDIEMPEMNGLEACTALKDMPKTANVPIVFMTAHQEPPVLAQGLDLGAIDFIPKDAFSDRVLLETLRQLNIL